MPSRLIKIDDNELRGALTSRYDEGQKGDQAGVGEASGRSVTGGGGGIRPPTPTFKENLGKNFREEERPDFGSQKPISYFQLLKLSYTLVPSVLSLYRERGAKGVNTRDVTQTPR